MELLCFNCGEDLIPPEEMGSIFQNYITISSPQFTMRSLHFHYKCFQEVAGVEYTEAMNDTSHVLDGVVIIVDHDWFKTPNAGVFPVPPTCRSCGVAKHKAPLGAPCPG